MKKKLLLILSIFLSLNLIGQTADYYKDKRHELRLSIGSVNDDYHNYYGYGYYWGYYWYGGYINNIHDYDAASYYSGDKKTTGAIGLHYFYHAPWLNGRFSFGGSVAFSNFQQDFKMRLSGEKIGDSKEYNIALTPTIRYAWIAKPMFQFYSGIGVSLYYNDYKYKATSRLEVMELKSDGFEASFMLTPIGFSVGRKVFGFGEINIGGRTGEFVGGVGYRF